MKLKSAVVAIEILETRPENSNLIQIYPFLSPFWLAAENKERVGKFAFGLDRKYSVSPTRCRSLKVQFCPFMWLLNVKSCYPLSLWCQTISSNPTKCKHKSAFHGHKSDTDCILAEIAGLRQLYPLVFLILADHVEFFNCRHYFAIFIHTSNYK